MILFSNYVIAFNPAIIVNPRKFPLIFQEFRTTYGGGVLRKIVYVDVPIGRRNFDFRYTVNWTVLSAMKNLCSIPK